MQPSPGLLPLDRTDGIRLFQTIGVDFAGPIKYLKKHKQEDCTRAVSHEQFILNSLETQEFLQSFKRLVTRMGTPWPSKVYSDNARTSVTAVGWLTKAQSGDKFNDYLATN